MKFSLIICGYNEENNLDRCIQSCLNQNFSKQQYEIIYVDNNSKDKSFEIANKYPIRVFSETNQGPSEARNLGIKESTGEILLFLDADTKVDPNYLFLCENKTFTDSYIGAGIGKIFPFTKTWISDYLGVSLFEGYPRFNRFKYMRGCPSCNLAIRKSVLERVGYFQKNLFSSCGVTRYSEDKEICTRIRQGGFKILYNPETTIFHENSYTFKKLFSIWVKGSRGRSTMIKLGKKDPFSLLLKYNIPVIYVLLIIVFFIYIPAISFSLFLLGLFCVLFLAYKAYAETGLLFQCIFIKPWMDTISLLIINTSVIYFRWIIKK